MRKLLIIHSDCLIATVENKWQFQKEVIQHLALIAKQLNFEFVLVENLLHSFPNEAINILENEQIFFKARILNTEVKLFSNTVHQFDPFISEQSAIVCRGQNNEGFLLLNLFSESILHHCANWSNVLTYLKAQPRLAKTHRKTSETDIAVALNLDGTGNAKVQTGIGFFDHMLEQIAKHGNFDLTVQATGDIQIDEHHTIEDVGIALGETFSKALGVKNGIERYGFLLPMDDCLAQVAVDFGGRPHLVWNVELKREKIGEMPTEMFYHFFKSFSDHAKCNINIKAEGENEHHKIEAVFKAFAKAIKIAVSKTNNFSIPSTKGVL